MLSQGEVDERQYAVKLIDNRLPKGVKAFHHEKRCLLALANCDGVVRFHAAGRLQDTLYPCISTEHAGRPSLHLSSSQRAEAKRAIKSLHAAGAAHGDIRLGNLIFDRDGSCRLADLATCSLQATEDEQKQDLLALKRLA